MLPRNTWLPGADMERLSAMVDALSRQIPPPCQPQPESTFLHRFPYELRLQIYEDLIDEEPVKLHYEGIGFKIEDAGIVGLAMACRQCRDEITPLFRSYATVQVDSASVVALKNISGIFDRHHIQKLVLKETELRVQEPVQKTTLVSGMLHCLEVFPELTTLHLVCKVSRTIMEVFNPDDILAKKQKILDAAVQGRFSTVASEFQQNSWPMELARRLAEALESHDDVQSIQASVEIPLQIKVLAPRDPRYGSGQGYVAQSAREQLIWGCVQMHLISMEVFWKVDGKRYKICDIIPSRQASFLRQNDPNVIIS